MKNMYTASTMLLATVTVLLFHSCLKDTGTKQFKVYTPVIKPSQEVRASVKSDMARPIVNAGKMYVYGNYIYLVEKEKGIHIIDNTNISSPVNKAFISIPGNEDIVVKDNILYADCFTDLFAIDISNPSAVVLKNYIVDLFPDRSYVNGYNIGNGRVITEWTVKDTMVNLTIGEGQGIWSNGRYLAPVAYSGGIFLSASAAATSSGATGRGGSMARMAIVNDRLYAVSQNLLSSVSISNPSAPGYLGNNNLHLGIGSAETIYPFQNKLFIGSMSGMYIFSITDPDNPVLLSTFTHATVCDPVITDGTNAYITLRSGTYCSGVQNELDVVDVQDVRHPGLLKKYDLSHPYGLSKDGHTLIVCDAGLKIYDATDPGNLQLKQNLAIADAYDVICIKGIALVSAKDGLYQIDYSNPANIKQLSKLGINQ